AFTQVQDLRMRIDERRLALAGDGNKNGIAGQIIEARKELTSAQKSLSICLAANAPETEPLLTSPIDGMMASLSLPAFFPSVWIGEEPHVDGGIRAVLPTEGAVLLGAKLIFAIQAGPRDLKR